MDPEADDDTSGSDRHQPLDPQLSVEDPDQSAREQDESRCEEEVSDAVHDRNVRRSGRAIGHGALAIASCCRDATNG